MSSLSPSSTNKKTNNSFVQKRFEARLAAVQALYQMDIAGSGINEILNEYECFRFGKIVDGISYEKADVKWFRKIVLGVVESQKKIDPLLNDILNDSWSLSRIDVTLRSILRVAAWEIIYEPNLQVGIIISQYVDVAKAFFSEEEPKIINSVLDCLSKKVRK